MFDTMTFTKTLGAVCGSLLVFLLIGWAGSALFYMGGGHGGAAAAVGGARAALADGQGQRRPHQLRVG